MDSAAVKSSKSPFLVCVAFAWVALITGGTILLLNFTNRPGLPGNAPARWPGGSKIVLGADYPTLIMAVHPRCACTRASLGELAIVLAQVEEQVTANILVPAPAANADVAEIEELKAEIAYTLSSPVIVDLDRSETKRFGLETSGHVLLYNQHGDLLFSGGITPGRGHAGASLGREALVARIRTPNQNSTLATLKSPTFGCSLFSHATSHGADEKAHI
jgi:hypothetical protein